MLSSSLFQKIEIQSSASGYVQRWQEEYKILEAWEPKSKSIADLGKDFPCKINPDMCKVDISAIESVLRGARPLAEFNSEALFEILSNIADGKNDKITLLETVKSSEGRLISRINGFTSAEKFEKNLNHDSYILFRTGYEFIAVIFLKHYISANKQWDDDEKKICIIDNDDIRKVKKEIATFKRIEQNCVKYGFCFHYDDKSVDEFLKKIANLRKTAEKTLSMLLSKQESRYLFYSVSGQDPLVERLEDGEIFPKSTIIS